MATVEIELRKYNKRKTKVVNGKKVTVEDKNSLRPLVLRVTSGSKVSRKNTGLYIRPEEWDALKRRVNRKHPEWSRLNDALDALVKEAEGIKADIIKDRQLVTPERVTKAVFSTRDFYALAEEKKNSFGKEQAGSVGTYERAIARVKAFAGPTLAIEEINDTWVKSFKKWLQESAPNEKAEKGKGYAHNTVVSTLRKVKSIIGEAGIKGENPFEKVTIGSYRRAKDEPLELEEIKLLERYIPRGKWEQIAKDTALFSFYSFGMRSADVLQLKWSNIKKGRIVYDQNKKANNSDEPTLSIPLNRFTEEILKRYDRTTETVFNLVTKFGGSKEAMKERERIQASIGGALTLMCLRAGIDKHVNFKLLRRSFAHIANQLSGRNVYAIQTAMDHKDIKTTEIYLGKDLRAIDELCATVYGQVG
jgi:integrase